MVGFNEPNDKCATCIHEHENWENNEYCKKCKEEEKHQQGNGKS